MEEQQTIKPSFLKRKDIEISAKRYLQDALSAMALGLFATLLMGTILSVLGEQTAILFGANPISAFLVEIGSIAKQGMIMGAGIGVAVATGLKAPPLVIYSSVVTGAMGATFMGAGIEYSGGPAGAFIAVALGAEFGKMVSKETKVDILITPTVTIIVGGVAAKLAGPAVGWCLMKLGVAIMAATVWQPFLFGIFIAIVVGLVLTAPISSAALCIMLRLSGLAAGAATAGCCAQMVGFAVASFRENGIGGLAAQGIGTSMLQVSNIIKHPWILVPPTLTAAIIGPLATCVFHMTNIPVGAGMGTCGLVGQIGTFTSMGFTTDVLWKVILLHIVLPAALAFVIDRIMRRAGLIKDGDYQLDL